MTPVPDPYEDEIAKWIRRHPKAASILAVVMIVAIFGLIGLNEWMQSRRSSGGEGAGITIGIVTALVLGYAAWRANRKIRKH